MLFQNLLMVGYDSVKTKRSHSADGRYFVRPKETERDPDAEGACGGCDVPPYDISRRNSTTSTHLAFPPQSLKSELLNNRKKPRSSRKTSANVGASTATPQDPTEPSSIHAAVEHETTPNVNIKIQINDDDGTPLQLE